MTAAAEKDVEDCGSKTDCHWAGRQEAHRRIGSLEAKLKLEREENARLQDRCKYLESLVETLMPY